MSEPSYTVTALDVRYVHDQMRRLMVEAAQNKAKGTLKGHLAAEIDSTAVTARELALRTLGLPLPDEYHPDWYEKLP
jgi:hypothetical protein